MKQYLAKSQPQETIQEHTDKLISNYNLLKTIYPNLKVDWDILKMACLYHDLGKMNRKFQDKICFGKICEDEIPHGILSLSFIPVKKLKLLGYSNDEIKILAHAIGYHHEREFDFTQQQLKEEIELLRKDASQFVYDKVANIDVRKISARFFSGTRISQRDGEENFYNYILVKGLLNRLDYAASGYIEVEKKNTFLRDSLNNLMQNWKQKNPNTKWNALQEHMMKNSNENIIVIAETGMGKTEAGLLWIGDNKGFFTLPLKTAINAMYSRVSKDIIGEQFENKVGLLHSDTYSEYLHIGDEQLDVDNYYNKTRQLSLPITICTLDQIFDFVYRYRGFEPKLATLAYSKVVIDEVQMYSPDLLAYLIIGLTYITKIGGKFAILTATLPQIVEDLLEEEGIDFVKPKTFTNDQRIRHSVKVVEECVNSEYILRLYNQNKVLVICNTVREAQRIYTELKEDYKIDRINLFHSNFIKKDRKEKEDNILEMGKRNSKKYGIWVTTQVVEASLDIDFDVLVTELSDLNGCFQRMGRCYRSRVFNEEGYNCYVFDGGENYCTGVGAVIDKEIFRLSKDALKNLDGKLKEKEKMELIKNLYTTQNLRESEYYKKIKNNIIYVKSIDENELSKNEVKKLFRNIQSTTVIPKDVYNKNKHIIHSYIEIIAKQYSKNMSKQQKKELREEKTKNRIALMEYTASVPDNRVHGNIVEQLKINQYEYVTILDCGYCNEVGIRYIDNKNKERNFLSKFM